jgi:hypothetical protein
MRIYLPQPEKRADVCIDQRWAICGPGCASKIDKNSGATATFVSVVSAKFE